MPPPPGSKKRGPVGGSPFCSTPFGPCPVAAEQGHPGNQRQPAAFRATLVPATARSAPARQAFACVGLSGVRIFAGGRWPATLYGFSHEVAAQPTFFGRSSGRKQGPRGEENIPSIVATIDCFN